MNKPGRRLGSSDDRSNSVRASDPDVCATSGEANNSMTVARSRGPGFPHHQTLGADRAGRPRISFQLSHPRKRPTAAPT